MSEAEHDRLAYTEAVNLATALFKKHFAHEEHYASGRVVWGPCDTTAGVISQIDNMVSGLVQPTTAPQAKPLSDERVQQIHNETGAGYALIRLVENYIKE